MGARHPLTVAVIAALFVSLAGAAQAANFTVTSKNRVFCCTNPPVFIAGQPAHKLKTNTMGSMTGSGFQPVVGPHPVTQVGTGTPSIKIDPGEVVDFYSKISQVKGGMTPPPLGFKYIKGTASFVNGAGTLKKGGGYGSFTFCPKAVGPAVGACTDPDDATPAYFKGRISVKAGPNKFGGTLQILAGPGGLGGVKNKVWRWGGLSSMYPALILDVKAITSPVGAMTPAKLNTVDELVTRIVTHTGGSMLLTVKNDTDAVWWANGAGPFTTGTVYLQFSGYQSGSIPFSVVISGYDKRTPMGAGNVQLVSGLVQNVYKNIKTSSFALGWKLNLPEPAPSLGLAAGALALLLLTRSARRR